MKKQVYLIVERNEKNEISYFDLKAYTSQDFAEIIANNMNENHGCPTRKYEVLPLVVDEFKTAKDLQNEM